MSLGPVEAEVQLKLGGVVADRFYAAYERAIIEAISSAEAWLQSLKADIPRATEDLRRSFQTETDLYGQTKTLKFGIYAKHAPYVLEFGRDPGKRPPWAQVRTWAAAKGVDLRQARAWWWAHGREGKRYRSPRGGSLSRWWSQHVELFKLFFVRELRARLREAGFAMSDVVVKIA